MPHDLIRLLISIIELAIDLGLTCKSIYAAYVETPDYRFRAVGGRDYVNNQTNVWRYGPGKLIRAPCFAGMLGAAAHANEDALVVARERYGVASPHVVAALVHTALRQKIVPGFAARIIDIFGRNTAAVESAIAGLDDAATDSGAASAFVVAMIERGLVADAAGQVVDASGLVMRTDRLFAICLEFDLTNAALYIVNSRPSHHDLTEFLGVSQYIGNNILMILEQVCRRANLRDRERIERACTRSASAGPRKYLAAIADFLAELEQFIDDVTAIETLEQLARAMPELAALLDSRTVRADSYDPLRDYRPHATYHDDCAGVSSDA
jgi:hypothetical protein